MIGNNSNQFLDSSIFNFPEPSSNKRRRISIDYSEDSRREVRPTRLEEIDARYQQMLPALDPYTKNGIIGFGYIAECARVAADIFSSIENGTNPTLYKRKQSNIAVSAIVDAKNEAIFLSINKALQEPTIFGSYKGVKKVLRLDKDPSKTAIFFAKKEMYPQSDEEMEDILNESTIQRTLGYPKLFGHGPSDLFKIEAKNEMDSTKMVQFEPFFSSALEEGDLSKPEHTISIIIQLLQQLIEMHQKKVLHGDIKRINILVDWQAGKNGEPEPFASFTDFGLSCSVQEGKKPTWVLEKGFYGSLKYTAPELLGNTSCDLLKAEIWAFGYTLQELLFPKDTAIQSDLPQNLFKKQSAVAEKVDGLKINNQNLLQQNQKLTENKKEILDQRQELCRKATRLINILDTYTTKYPNDSQATPKTVEIFKKNRLERDQIKTKIAANRAKGEEIKASIQLNNWKIDQNNRSIEEILKLEQTKESNPSHVFNRDLYKEAAARSYTASLNNSVAEKNLTFRRLKQVIVGLIHPDPVMRLTLQEALRILIETKNQHMQQENCDENMILIRC